MTASGEIEIKHLREISRRVLLMTQIMSYADMGRTGMRLSVWGSSGFGEQIWKYLYNELKW